MKKLFTAVLSLFLTFSLAACGCQAQETTPTTVPTTAATTAATTAPTTEATSEMTTPSMETNIPDPSVGTSMPDTSEGSTDSSESTGEGMQGSEGAGNESRMRR